MKFFLKILNQINLFYFIIKNASSKIKFDLKLYNKGLVLLGKNISIDKGCVIRVQEKSSLLVDNNVFIGKDSEIDSNKRILIGAKTTIQSRANIFGDVEILSNCIVGPNLYVSSYSHEFSKEPSQLINEQDKFLQNSKPVIINEDCFIGINVFIKPGITIGRGSVIGANTTVLDDVYPYSVVAGNPGKVIKKRYNFLPQDQICSNKFLDMPYFYKGFGHWIDKKCADDLYLMSPEFTLALNTNKKKEIKIKIDVSFDSNLFFINTKESLFFNKNTRELVFSLKKNQSDFLVFNCTSFIKNINRFKIVSAEVC
jgi:acetyltransferase-like isoleucine patch superfamily enzyme